MVGLGSEPGAARWKAQPKLKSHPMFFKEFAICTHNNLKIDLFNGY